MALQKPFLTAQGFQANEAYHRITMVHVDLIEEYGYFVVSIYKDADARNDGLPFITQKTLAFSKDAQVEEYEDDDGNMVQNVLVPAFNDVLGTNKVSEYPNIIAACYDHLKTTDEYSEALDI